MNDCITKTKQSTTKPCAYLLAYTLDTDGHYDLLQIKSRKSRNEILQLDNIIDIKSEFSISDNKHIAVSIMSWQYGS